MSSEGIENSLHEAMKNLLIEWQNTRTYWRDVKCQEFEQKYLEPLPHQVARATLVIAEINALLRKARNDCG